MLKFSLFIAALFLAYGAHAQMSLHPLTIPPQGSLTLIERNSLPSDKCKNAVTMSIHDRGDHYLIAVEDDQVPRERCPMFAVITMRHYVVPKNKITWAGSQRNGQINYAVYHGNSSLASFPLHANAQAKFSDLRIYPNSPFLAQFVEILRLPNGKSSPKVYVLPNR